MYAKNNNWLFAIIGLLNIHTNQNSRLSLPKETICEINKFSVDNCALSHRSPKGQSRTEPSRIDVRESKSIPLPRTPFDQWEYIKLRRK